jgi:Tfp pilus assembly protein PilE
MKYIGILAIILLILHPSYGQITQKPILIEAESFVSQTKDKIRKWVVQKSDSASGKKYIKLTPDTRITHDDSLIVGVNFSNEPGKMSIVSYKVNIPKAGRYYVWARALSTGGEDNSVHVGLDGTWAETGARMQWCDGKGRWYFESKQRTEAVHCGEPYLIYLDITKKGQHTIQFSLREDGFAMDKFLLTTDKNFKPNNNK